MKKLMIALALILGGGSVCAQSNGEVKNDTVGIGAGVKTELVEHKTTSSKGKVVTKYFVLVGGELIPTSKSVAERMKLCKEYNAKCALAIVKSGKNGKKRVILD